MSQIIDTLNTVMANVAKNKDNVDTALAQAEQTAGTFSPDVTAAMELLLNTFPNAQVAAQMLSTHAQTKQLATMAGELDALTAALQIVISDESLLEATQAQATANAGATNSPLPEAAAGGESAAANASAHPVETAAADSGATAGV